MSGKSKLALLKQLFFFATAGAFVGFYWRASVYLCFRVARPGATRF
jgi:hypothetical protein